jgi:hypothetical protein
MIAIGPVVFGGGRDRRFLIGYPADVSELRSFLRLGSHLLELLERPVLIGRSGSCDLVVDDELASREHCRVTIEGGRVWVTDLESRNGVLVNGARVVGKQELHHGDTITIGTHPVVLLRQHRAPRLTPITGDDHHRGDDEPTRHGDIFQLLHGSAMAALTSGDVTAAEGGARNLFVVIRATLARSVALSPGALTDAVELALTLAERTGESRWLEQALDALVSARAVLSGAQTRRFVELARRVGAPTRAVGEYVRMAAQLAGGDASAKALQLL